LSLVVPSTVKPLSWSRTRSGPNRHAHSRANAVGATVTAADINETAASAQVAADDILIAIGETLPSLNLQKYGVIPYE
jgi:hypothetical protein